MIKNFIFPHNLRIRYQEAKNLEVQAEETGRKDILLKSLNKYEDILEDLEIPDDVFITIAEKCLHKLKAAGYFDRAINIHKKVIHRFPLNSNYKNQLAVTYLMINRSTEAKLLLQQILKTWPSNTFAQAHYGLILKTIDNDLIKSLDYLKSGLASTEKLTIRNILYFHLGDALTKLGKNIEADQVYERAVKENIFLSKYQRSLYNVKRLKANPWWSKKSTPFSSFFKLLEDNWKVIRDEALHLIDKNDYFQHETENIKDIGEWKQLELFSRGVKMENNCRKCPLTCKIIDSLPDAKYCKRGQVKFSIIQPGTHIWPHCGPTNCRLRSHLGLKIPENTYLRIVNETRTWKEGEVLIFDDSFEHEVWHNGTGIRLILIIDFWHPELTEEEKRSLIPI